MGSSAIGELARINDNFATNTFPDGVDLMNKLRNVVKYFEASPTDRKNYDKVLQDNIHLLTNEFKRDLNGTKISAV